MSVPTIARAAKAEKRVNGGLGMCVRCEELEEEVIQLKETLYGRRWNAPLEVRLTRQEEEFLQCLVAFPGPRSPAVLFDAINRGNADDVNKLVNVIKIVEQDDDSSVARELVLIKVRADASVRSEVIETVNLFRAKVIDVSPEAVTVEATGTRSKLDALLKMLDPYGIREIVQSGVVAVGRGPKSITASR